jgi:circadian clock protein KaiC
MATRDAAPNGRSAAVFPRISSGNPQIDQILHGGFPENSINIVMGQPGTGKTVFAEQLVFHNADPERPTLYYTTLSEPLAKVVRYAQGFGFFDDSKVGSGVTYDDLGLDLARDGVGALLPRLRDAIRTVSPKLIIIDSFKAVKDLAPSLVDLRRLVHELTGVLTAYDTTVFLLGEYQESDIALYPEFAAADGIIEFLRRNRGARDERYLRVLKLRGSHYQEGAHAFRITNTGLEVFPRLVSPATPPAFRALYERTTTGIDGLDEMTMGGFWQGSCTLLNGVSGSGKTTLALQFALAGVRIGEPALYVNFQESPTQLSRSIRWLSVDLAQAEANGLEFMYASPVELQIDSVIVELFNRIEQKGIRRLVIDALGDLASSAYDRQRAHDYLYAMIQHLIANDVTSLLTMETTPDRPLQGGLEPISSLSDNTIQLGMIGDEVTRRTLRIIKTRGSAHDPRVREIEITQQGVRLI